MNDEAFAQKMEGLNDLLHSCFNLDDGPPLLAGMGAAGVGWFGAALAGGPIGTFAAAGMAVGGVAGLIKEHVRMARNKQQVRRYFQQSFIQVFRQAGVELLLDDQCDIVTTTRIHFEQHTQDVVAM